MSDLSDMPNIGKVCAGQLVEVGIDTPQKLIEVGSREAFIRIRMIDPGACINKLYALEGAVRGVRKSDLPQKEKDGLKAFFNSL